MTSSKQRGGGEQRTEQAIVIVLFSLLPQGNGPIGTKPHASQSNQEPGRAKI
jgi:hypothetical protein